MELNTCTARSLAHWLCLNNSAVIIYFISHFAFSQFFLPVFVFGAAETEAYARTHCGRFIYANSYMKRTQRISQPGPDCSLIKISLILFILFEMLPAAHSPLRISPIFLFFACALYSVICW